jgi:peptidyl-prolyl cis-trans isomerase SurA
MNKSICRCVLFPIIVLTLATSPGAMQRVDGVIAVVGDSAILQSELDAFAMMKAGQSGHLPDSLEMNILRNQSLQELIDGKVLLVHAEKDTNISISDYEIEEELNNRITMILRQNGLTMDNFEEVLQKQDGMTLTKFKMEIRKQIRNELIKQKVQQRYVSSAALSKKEVTAFYETYKDSLPANGKSVLLSTIVRQIRPSDKIRQESYTKITAIKTRLSKGEDFTALAKQYSEDPNAAQGGDLGLISKGTLSELTFEERAFSLNVGEISDPFETRLGFHIITIIGKKDQMVHVKQIFISVKPPEEEIVRSVALLDSIRSNTRSADDFVRSVKQFSQDDVSKSRDGQLKWQTVAGLEPQIARAIDTLPEGGITAPLRRENSAAIYRVDKRLDSRPLTLDIDWNQIADIAYRITNQTKLFDIVKKWRQETYIDIRL